MLFGVVWILLVPKFFFFEDQNGLCLSFFSLKIKMENCLLTGRTRHTLEVSSETCDA